MISVHAPDGIGEVDTGTDLAAVIARACRPAPLDGLRDGDVVVVTSKVISKHEGRRFPAEEKLALRLRETTRTVARKLGTAIVATRHGLVQAAAGIDASNVDTGTILALPLDPDASAQRLRRGLMEVTGARIAVVVSDTAGRAWRVGQTDHAIGCAGIRALISYDGVTDPYGNALHVTLTAVADEVAAAADLAKGKLGGRPVAVLRGLADLVLPADEPGDPARVITRPVEQDLFSRGSRESVLTAVLAVLGAEDRYEELVLLDAADEVVAALTGSVAPEDLAWCRRLLTTAYATFG